MNAGVRSASGVLAPGSELRERLKRRLPMVRPLVHRARAARYQVLYVFDPKPDRHILEEVIFPALAADPDVGRVLSVGCAWYTRNYRRRLPGGEYWTVDIDPRMARYGGQRHIVGSVADLPDHVEPGTLDAIICNGVFGFGLDTRADCERAFAACYASLRPGGWLIVGWNDDGYHAPFPLESLASIEAFARRPLPPFPTWRYPTFSRIGHTFDFYVRPEAAEGEAPAVGAATAPSRLGALAGCRGDLQRAGRGRDRAPMGWTAPGSLPGRSRWR